MDKTDRKGFTVLEMLLVIFIVSIIAAALGALGSQIVADFFHGRQLADRQSQATLALERFVRDIRRSANQNIQEDGARLNLIIPGEDNLSYHIDNTTATLQISINGGQEQILARHVHQSSFFDRKTQADQLQYRLVLLHFNIELPDGNLLEFSASAVPRRN